MDDLTLIRQVLRTLYEEVHHPGYCNAIGCDVDAIYDKAIDAWKRLGRRDAQVQSTKKEPTEREGAS